MFYLVIVGGHQVLHLQIMHLELHLSPPVLLSPVLYFKSMNVISDPNRHLFSLPFILYLRAAALSNVELQTKFKCCTRLSTSNALVIILAKRMEENFDGATLLKMQGSAICG